MKIRNIDLGPRPVLLAPMEDVTDIGFRLLCRSLGASMVYSEFVASDALVRMVGKSLDKLRVSPDERPVAIQIYGKDPIAMRDAAQIVVEKAHPDVLDLNFGCPVKRVAGKGAGAGLLQNIPLLLDITRHVVDAVSVPVTAKTRLGWDSEHLVITSLAEQLQDCGIEALTIHGRTRAQMYQGQADHSLIGEVRRNPRIHIPIIANGDIAELVGIGHYEERFGLHFADARLCFPDYDDLEIEAKVCLDTLDSESASLTWEQQNALYQGVMEDYQSLSTKKKRYDAVKADPFYNALQLKYANAITCHKSQGGQWKCVFIDNPLWQEEFGVDDYKWLYTAITRAVEKVYLVNFKDEYFI